MPQTAQETTMSERRILQLWTTSSHQRIFLVTHSMNFHCLEKRTIRNVDGAILNMRYLFILRRCLTIFLVRNTSKFTFFILIIYITLLQLIHRNVMHDAEHGVIDISECEWPSFLYPQGTSPDVEDDQKGLFRGYLLLMVFLTSYILTSAYFFAGIPTNFYRPTFSNEARGRKKGTLMQSPLT